MGSFYRSYSPLPSSSSFLIIISCIASRFKKLKNIGIYPREYFALFYIWAVLLLSNFYFLKEKLSLNEDSNFVQLLHMPTCVIFFPHSAHSSFLKTPDYMELTHLSRFLSTSVSKKPTSLSSKWSFKKWSIFFSFSLFGLVLQSLVNLTSSYLPIPIDSQNYVAINSQIGSFRDGTKHSKLSLFYPVNM